LIDIKGRPGMSGSITNAATAWLERVMDVREIIYGRRAMRELTTEPGEESELRRFIDAAIPALLISGYGFVGTVAFPRSNTA
jgi:hypothetical protein